MFLLYLEFVQQTNGAYDNGQPEDNISDRLSDESVSGVSFEHKQRIQQVFWSLNCISSCFAILLCGFSLLVKDQFDMYTICSCVTTSPCL